jgi:hypothetical protein
VAFVYLRSYVLVSTAIDVVPYMNGHFLANYVELSFVLTDQVIDIMITRIPTILGGISSSNMTLQQGGE